MAPLDRQLIAVCTPRSTWQAMDPEDEGEVKWSFWAQRVRHLPATCSWMRMVTAGLGRRHRRPERRSSKQPRMLTCAGGNISALDGTVRVNLAKLILRPITDEELTAKATARGGVVVDSTYWVSAPPDTTGRVFTDDRNSLSPVRL